MSATIKPLNLYELTTELLQFEAELMENGGEITEEMEERYAELLEAREDKIEGYIAVIRSLEATADAIQAERIRLQNNERAAKSAVEAVKARLLQAMQRRDEAEHKTKLGKVKRQKGPARVVLTADIGPEHLPLAFQRIKVEADLTEIKNWLTSPDDDVRAEAEQYARLEEGKEFIRIY